MVAGGFSRRRLRDESEPRMRRLMKLVPNLSLDDAVRSVITAVGAESLKKAAVRNFVPV